MSLGGDPRYDDHVFRADQPTPWLSRALLAGLLAACVAAPARDDAITAIVVRATEARESPDGETLTVSGALSLSAPDWHLSADGGRIEGALEDPDLITVTGRPARLEVRRARDAEPFEGSSERIEFRPKLDAVKLSGDALVVKGGQSIRSGRIDYALDVDTFKAGFGDRVRVVTEPEHAR